MRFVCLFVRAVCGFFLIIIIMRFFHEGGGSPSHLQNLGKTIYWLQLSAVVCCVYVYFKFYEIYIV